MRYLRILSNCLIAGLVGAAYLTILFLQLNPHFPLQPTSLGPLAGTLALFYGANLTVGFYALIVIGQLFATDVFSPGWLSLRLLAWLSAAAALAGVGLMWVNLREFDVALDPDVTRRAAVGVLAMSGCALVMLTIAVVHYSFGRRGSWVGATLFSLALAASIALPLFARGPAGERPLGAYRLDVSGWMAPKQGSARVVMILADGASLDYIVPVAAENRLPNFGRLLDAGAALHLATLRPTQQGPVWTAVATGKYPFKHGVRSAAMYQIWPGVTPLELLPDLCFAQALVHLGFLTELAPTSASLRARPLWSMLSSFGISVGVVGWPLTYPAQPVLGYLVSDRFHLAVDSPLEPEASAVAYPPDVLPQARAAASRILAETARILPASSGADPPVEAAGPDAIPAARDAVYARVAAALEGQIPAQFLVVRYQGLDTMGHRYLRYVTPHSFGDVSEEERRRYGQVLDGYYRFVDSEIGQVIETLGPNDLLLVVSGFGMEPVSPGKRLLGRLFGDPDLTGTHERAPDGFLLAYGAAVEPGRRPRGSVVDVAPTVLYYLGLPVGRDVDGYVRTDLFRRRFTAERPITFIPTYER